jgi:hypothetical protein
MREALREAGRQTLVAGNVTNVHGSTNEPLSEQDTQLMDAPHAAPTVAGVDEQKPASVPSQQEATVADAALATSVGAAPHITNSKEQAESVVTQVRPPVPAKRSLSGRTLGIVAGAVVLVLLSVVVYALTRRNAQPANTQTAPAETSTPPANPSPTEQANANQNQNASIPEAAPVKSAAPEKNKQRATESAKAKEALPALPAQPNKETPPRPDTPPDRPGQRRDNPYYDSAQAEEARREAAMARQQAREQRRLAEEEKRRIREMRRRERMRQP